MKAIDIAKYYLSKDVNRELFNNKIVVNNNRKSYEGNIRLNKYLFLTQVVYLAKYDKLLFDDEFVAYDNGPVISKIVENYARISTTREKVEIPKDIKDFVDKIYGALINATSEELIEITHEDPEWIRLKPYTYYAPVLKLENNINEYKKRYKGLIEALKL